jgi:RNA polymerase sigma-70 factor (ECF subfamily)
VVTVETLEAMAEPVSAGDPDREALARAGAGDPEAFAVLVERHQERLLRLCERMLGDREAARDAVQEVFLKAYRRAGSYRPRGAVFTWLYRIAVNHCLNRLRRRRVVRFLRLEGESEPGDDPGPAPAGRHDPADPAPGPAAAAAARDDWRTVSRAIAGLPPGQRAVLVLARFEGLRYRQIAEHLGITEGAVESRLFRAVRRLEAALAQGAAPPRVSSREERS